MILPVTTFGILSALAELPLGTTYNQDCMTVLARIPPTLLWVWLNVLVFSISNQRSPESVLEDSINKPWRPIPAGKIDMIQARRLLLGAVVVVPALVVQYLGAIHETVLCIVGTWMYNDLGGADDHFIIRNLLNSVAYVLYCSGAMRVACGDSLVTSNGQTYHWLCIIGGIIFTTSQVQDLKDQLGDHERNRHTAPLALGNFTSRWIIAFGVLIWSIVCSMYWNLNLLESLIPLSFGVLVAIRVLALRTPTEDRTTYQAWSFWLVILFSLPLLKARNIWKILSEKRSGLRVIEEQLERIPCFPLLRLAIPGICGYVLLVYLLRYRRRSSLESLFKENGALSSMSITTAQEIYVTLANIEFPFTFMKANQFALFRTYGIPSISSLLVKTTLLSSPTSAPQRYSDTEVLFTEFALRKWGSQEWLEAMSRVKCIHSGYRKTKKIHNDDMLYTVAAVALQSVRWIDRWEWRELTDVERCAIGVVWKGIADALEISYQGIRGYEKGNGWNNGLEWLNDLEEWMERYEERVMVLMDTNVVLADQTISMFLWSAPMSLKATGREVISCLMDNRLRTAMKLNKPPRYIFAIVHGLLFFRQLLLKYFALPRPSFLAVQRSSKTSSQDRFNAVNYFVAPFYVQPTLTNRWSFGACIRRLQGLPLPGDHSELYQPQGYRIKDLGPDIGRLEQEATEADLRKKSLPASSAVWR